MKVKTACANMMVEVYMDKRDFRNPRWRKFVQDIKTMGGKYQPELKLWLMTATQAEKSLEKAIQDFLGCEYHLRLYDGEVGI